MSDATQQALLQALQNTAQGGAQAGAASGWNQPPAAAGVAGLIQGVAIPIKVETPAGTVKAFLSLPAEVGQNPQAMMNAIQGLIQAGFPVDAFQSRNGGGWGSGNGNGGGYRGNGGGYGGRGNYGNNRW